MDVADVAAAGGVGAGTGLEDGFKVGVVDVAKLCFDEVAAFDSTIAVNGNDAFSGAARAALAGMVLVVDGEERIDAGEGADLLGTVVIGLAFVGVDPQVDM